MAQLAARLTVRLLDLQVNQEVRGSNPRGGGYQSGTQVLFLSSLTPCLRVRSEALFWLFVFSLVRCAANTVKKLLLT